MHGVHVYKGRPQSAFVLLSVRDMMNEMRLVHETTDDSDGDLAPHHHHHHRPTNASFLVRDLIQQLHRRRQRHHLDDRGALNERLQCIEPKKNFLGLIYPTKGKSAKIRKVHALSESAMDKNMRMDKKVG